MHGLVPRACYVELVRRRRDTAAFIQCHVNAFEYLGGVPRRCLYDNAKVVTLGKDEEKPADAVEPADAGLRHERLGFEASGCASPYRAQTKGKVESGSEIRPAQYVAQHALHRRRRSQPARRWSGATRWPTPGVHGTTLPGALGDAGRGAAAPGPKLPDPGRVGAILSVQDRKVSRDGFVSWEGSRYGVHWKWVDAPRCRWASVRGTVEIWAGGERIAVHPRAQGSGTELHPARASGPDCPREMAVPGEEAVAVQVPVGEVERRSLDVYELAAVGGVAMIALEQARQHLQTLGLKQAVEVLDNTLDAAANQQLPYPEMLAQLLGVEVSRPPGTLPHHPDPAGPPALPAHPGAV